MAGQSVLLISKVASLRKRVEDACRSLETECTAERTLDAATPVLQARSPDVVVCDQELFDELRATFDNLCVLLIGRPTDSEKLIDAIKRGAIDYLIEPVGEAELERHLREALRISRDIRVPAVYEDRPVRMAVDEIVGQSPAMKEMYKLIGLIAPRDINVLITGESGTGKELVARAILHHSPRRTKPYLAVNCAAIPETLLESELFGHEKGAFTGAEHRRIGKFEQCTGGTLFLDEVGDIPLTTQAKLLRVLQDNTFQRLGGTETIRADVRIVAATHQPLEQLIQERRFRQDLFYRLKVASIHVPALREREVDVVLLAHYFANRANRDFGTNIQSFAPEVLPMLLTYPWPGNVRELENAIKSSLVVAKGTIFRPEFLPDHIREGRPLHTPQRRASDRKGESSAPSSSASSKREGSRTSISSSSPTNDRDALADAIDALLRTHEQSNDAYRRVIAPVEREILRAALQRTGGRLAPAARMLGLSRTTLRKKMQELGIEVTAEIRFEGD